jgi:hypothetical protein
MTDIIERLHERITWNTSIPVPVADPIYTDAIAEITRLRALETQVKALLALVGTSDATIDLNVPLAFRTLKDKIDKDYKALRGSGVWSVDDKVQVISNPDAEPFDYR